MEREIRITTKPSKARLLQLDGLRGVAALWVVLFHFTGHWQSVYGTYE